MEDSKAFDAIPFPSDGSLLPISGHEETDTLGADLLDGLDSYLEDINDRLTISRMVNDSVIKGMVNAVTEEAAERITLKESEVASLKERLHFYESGAYKVKKLEFRSLSDDVVRQDSVGDFLGNSRMASEKQLHILENKIKDIKSCRFGPGQSKIKESENWTGVDQAVSTLRNMLNTVFTEVDSMVGSLKTSPGEWQKERDFRDEVEAMVIRSSIRSLQEDFKVQLLEQKTQFCGIQTTNQRAKINQLSDLHQELSSITRLLSIPEMGQLPLNGSQEGSEECNNGKRKDNFYSQANSRNDSNGKHEESKRIMSETLDSAKLKGMSKDEVINHFKNEIVQMKRNHESSLQEKTEQYFSLRREFLKERGPLFSLRRDKEFEAFRKKIPEVIVKLDNMLMEIEKSPLVHEDDEIICSLKNRIDTLLSENRHIKDLLTKKRKEVKGLSSQVSSAAEKMSHHSLTEANLLKQIRKLKSDIKDMRIEVSIREDVCKCILKDLIGKTKLTIQDSDMQSVVILEIYEIMFRELITNAMASIKCDIEDSDMESIVMHEIHEIIFREAANDALGTINLVKMKYEDEKVQRLSLEASMLETETTLNLEIEENERLKQEILGFPAWLEKTEKLALEKGSLLIKEEQCKELNVLRNEAHQKDLLLSESRNKSNVMKSQLEEALEKIQSYEEEKLKLDQMRMIAMKDLMRANEKVEILHGIIEEKENALSLVEAKEIEQKKEVKSVTTSLHRLLVAAAEFEGRTMEAVEKNDLRLRRLKCQLDPLLQNARKMDVVYKQRLEKRYSDLQKAEAEVDLLGDEVDALLSLLEKIYIALYHYSPVLQHYPGIMEILKLIRRELSVETAYDAKKSVQKEINI